ncbi:MAG: sulfotransferase family protein [Gammaproteobacteria bacterium]|nr:sulfotransferase family protein [Gammaproteobacteria bacterium]
MSLQVIGAGFGRTGTLSLKVALEQLGFNKCYHMTEVFEQPEHIPIWAAAHRGEAIDWNALYRGYRAAVDWPACNLWREQLAAFPEAKVILSTRDPERWYESVMNTIYPSSMAAAHSDEPGLRHFGQWAEEIIWKRIFDGRMDDRDHVLAVYRRHVESVIAEAPADRLLVFEAAEGWGPLCAFLGVPQPEGDYPRTNTTEDFLAQHAPPPESADA